jgi:hypothetical protein
VSSQRPDDDGSDDWLVLHLQQQTDTRPGCLAFFMVGFLVGLALLVVAAVLVALAWG